LNKTNSVIEVNGNRYDAVTGQLLNAVHKAKNHTKASTKTVIDGFVLGSHHTKKHIKKTVALPAKKRPHVIAGDVHVHPQRSRTLMRQIVRSPAAAPKKAASHHPKAVSHHINPAKEFRAKTAVKHPGVNRFGYFSDKKPAAAPIKPDHHHKAMQVEILPDRQALPSMVTSVSHRKLEKMLDEALTSADAHKHMMNAGRKRSYFKGLAAMPRWIKFTTAAVLLFVIAIFLIWQNLPAVAVRVAATRAHVNAAIPSYTPDGFIYSGDLSYLPGAVTMQFKDKRHSQETFSLTQKASNWSSASLEANVLPKDNAVQTSEVNGTTVYIYGNNNDAMWVNRNVLYQIQNKANLSSDQVLKIVQSL
jgi:hypothetical protein